LNKHKFNRNGMRIKGGHNQIVKISKIVI
jgi:hypothetical protein